MIIPVMVIGGDLEDRLVPVEEAEFFEGNVIELKYDRVPNMSDKMPLPSRFEPVIIEHRRQDLVVTQRNGELVLQPIQDKDRWFIYFAPGEFPPLSGWHAASAEVAAEWFTLNRPILLADEVPTIQPLSIA